MKKIILFVVILLGLAILGIGLYDHYKSKEPAEETPVVDELPGDEDGIDELPNFEDEEGILSLDVYFSAYTDEMTDYIKVYYMEGMTWAEWIDSKYNIYNAIVYDEFVHFIFDSEPYFLYSTYDYVGQPDILISDVILKRKY